MSEPKNLYTAYKKINELKREIARLEPYERLSKEIFDAIMGNLVNNNGTNSAWLAKKFWQVFK